MPTPTPQQHARHAALDLAVALHTRSVRFLENEAPGDLTDEVLSTAQRFTAFILDGTVAVEANPSRMGGESA